MGKNSKMVLLEKKGKAPATATATTKTKNAKYCGKLSFLPNLPFDVFCVVSECFDTVNTQMYAYVLKHSLSLSDRERPQSQRYIAHCSVVSITARHSNVQTVKARLASSPARGRSSRVHAGPVRATLRESTLRYILPSACHLYLPLLLVLGLIKEARRATLRELRAPITACEYACVRDAYQRSK